LVTSGYAPAHTGDRAKIKGLIYLKEEDKLLSAGDDRLMVVWDMSIQREEVRCNLHPTTCQSNRF